jgi:hypothetical protein
MADVKVQIVVDGKALDLDPNGANAELWKTLRSACRTKKEFGGTAYKDHEYGTVEVEVKGKPYTIRVGNSEWEQAEKSFGVKGVMAVNRACESEANKTAFMRICLNRHQPNIKHAEVQELRDWRNTEGRFPLQDAFERALAFSKPYVFVDEEVDPKALEAVNVALLLAGMNLPDSTSTS